MQTLILLNTRRTKKSVDEYEIVPLSQTALRLGARYDDRSSGFASKIYELTYREALTGIQGGLCMLSIQLVISMYAALTLVNIYTYKNRKIIMQT